MTKTKTTTIAARIKSVEPVKPVNDMVPVDEAIFCSAEYVACAAKAEKLFVIIPANPVVAGTGAVPLAVVVEGLLPDACEGTPRQDGI